MAKHLLRTDGGARGNPGPAAAAYVLYDAEAVRVTGAARFLGTATNNVAEYEALVWGLEQAAEAGVEALAVEMDSELIVRQIEGSYRVKDDKLRPLHSRAIELLESFGESQVSHIPRASNREADALVNEALDEELGVASEPAGQSRGGGMYELTVKDHFDAAHALHGYPGECSELHGHTWDVEVTVEGSRLDDIGIVYDFKRLKEDVASVLESYDHTNLNDVAPFDEINPTGENLARVICEALVTQVGSEVTVKEVVVWESPIARLVYRPG